ncbi:unnamed protein product [Citrullus colocynthis]|uniref:Uncharacterized protein n=1 Tax=Citrullus colocynthis TaxID=252529 RepID=A0ABP0Y4C1_9ROSI
MVPTPIPSRGQVFKAIIFPFPYSYSSSIPKTTEDLENLRPYVKDLNKEAGEEEHITSYNSVNATPESEITDTRVVRIETIPMVKVAEKEKKLTVVKMGRNYDIAYARTVID